MDTKLFLYLAILIFPILAHGQLSLKNPLICHDKDNYLKCYNDGSYRLQFDHGNFKSLKTSDNFFHYSDKDKKIVFLTKDLNNSLIIDTTELTLLPKSILIKKGSSLYEIKSLKEIPGEMNEYGINTYSVNNFIRGLFFHYADKSIEIAVQTDSNTWSWAIQITEDQRILVLEYNSFKKNRIQNIIIKDNILRCGMSIFTNFRTLKRISKLESFDIDTFGTHENKKTVISSPYLNHFYKYVYSKAGKLKKENSIGDLKFCNCN